MEKLYRLLYPMKVVLITARHEDKDSIMPAAWCFPLSRDPAMFGVSLAKERFTYELIEKSNKFAINIPDSEMKEQIIKCGSTTGRDIDKFAETGFTKEEGRMGNPLIAECYASVECDVEKIIETGDHYLVIGKVVNFVKRTEPRKGIYQVGGTEFAEL